MLLVGRWAKGVWREAEKTSGRGSSYLRVIL